MALRASLLIQMPVWILQARLATLVVVKIVVAVVMMVFVKVTLLIVMAVMALA